jgi:hypothetical protein
MQPGLPGFGLATLKKRKMLTQISQTSHVISSITKTFN